KDEKRAEYIVQRSTLVAVGLSAMLVLALVCGLTWLATAGDKYLPRLLVDRTHTTSLNTSLGAPVVLICATAIAVLWTGRRSVLDQWLSCGCSCDFGNSAYCYACNRAFQSWLLRFAWGRAHHLNGGSCRFACRDGAALCTPRSLKHYAAARAE